MLTVIVSSSHHATVRVYVVPKVESTITDARTLRLRDSYSIDHRPCYILF